MADVPVSPAPVTTDVLWDSLVGARLEELLFGLLDAMGAKELVWRAGSDSGVTANDGGRDLEAVFERPTPEGDVDRKLWWVEAKGRAGTVPKGEVQSFVVNATARTDIDVLVFCTNTRFSNPTRDWVAEWMRSRPIPEIRLWDRDVLSTLVRRYPLVAARVVPEALDDSDRLDLLLERFHRLGEVPTEEDLAYFWERAETVAQSADAASVIAMFVYAEHREYLLVRPWALRLPEDELTATRVVVEAFGVLPTLLFGQRPRPLSSAHLVETAAYLVLSVITRMTPEGMFEVALNPLQFFDETSPLYEMARSEGGAKFLDVWRESFVIPTCARIQDELRDVCGNDCVRVSVEPDAFPPALLGAMYWRRFGVGDAPPDRRLMIEDKREPCVVGLPLAERGGRCPLLRQKFEVTADFFADLQAIVAFRHTNPEGQFLRVMRERRDDK